MKKIDIGERTLREIQLCEKEQEVITNLSNPSDVIESMKIILDITIEEMERWEKRN